ncbi:MAG: GNAT family N-acetyltransferase [Woeseia sp.]
MDASIQRLSADNVERLQRIAPDVFDFPIDPTQLQAFLDDPRHSMVIAVVDDTVVGMASAVEYFHPDKQPQMWVNEIGVTPEHQRQGVGRRLLEALLKISIDRGCVFAWLGTDVNNKAAQACFQSVAGGASPQPFLLYEWHLSGRPE